MKTLLLKSNLLIKPSIILAAAVFTAAFLPVPFARAAPGPLDARGTDGVQPFDPNPAAPRFDNPAVYDDGTAPTVPVKTLRITNNTGQTVYPIMREYNSNTIKGSETIGLL